MVNVGNRILPKYAVVIGESVEAVSLLGKGDEVTTMPIGQFDGLRPEPVPGAAVVGAAGRLWAVSQARIHGQLKGKVAAGAGQVDQAASYYATTSLGARRAAAFDGLALGMTGWGSCGRPVDNRNRVVQGLVRGGSRQRHRPTGRADATPR